MKRIGVISHGREVHTIAKNTESVTSEPKAAKVVDVYGSPTCSKCDSLKQYLHHNHVLFNYHDVMEDNDSMRKLIGMHVFALPVVTVNDELFDAGFNVEKINKLFEEDM